MGIELQILRPALNRLHQSGSKTIDLYFVLALMLNLTAVNKETILMWVVNWFHLKFVDVRKSLKSL